MRPLDFSPARPTPAACRAVPTATANRDTAAPARSVAVTVLAIVLVAVYAGLRIHEATARDGPVGARLLDAFLDRWCATVPVSPSVAAAGIAAVCILARASRPRSGVSFGGVWGGVILSLGLLGLYFLALTTGML